MTRARRPGVGLTNRVLSTIFASEQPTAFQHLEFVYTRLFERTRKGVLADDEVKAVEDSLLQNPEAGALMADTGGVRKTRAAREGQGKRGSARVAYLYVKERQTVYFLLAFPKNVQGNLTANQKKIVRQVAADIRREEWPRKNRGH